MTALKIAVIMNGFETLLPPVKASFESAISSATNPGTPVPSITYYDPIVAQSYPDPTMYDLIVLSGGTADPMGSVPWVLKLQNYLRTTVRDFPKQKFVGNMLGTSDDMHEFHRRVVEVPAGEFVPLVEGNQSFVNKANTIVTFQGHPELNIELAKTWLANATSYTREGLAKSMENKHDGVRIWKRILEWVKE